jgi:anti-sigma28 factor (negative regulator of flagellin synthesis)
MRVTEHHIPSGPDGTGATEQAGEAGRSTRSGQASRTAGEDQVKVSGLAGRIAEALAGGADQRQVRIEQLAAAWRSGELGVDAARLSRRLVDSMLGAG